MFLQGVCYSGLCPETGVGLWGWLDRDAAKALKGDMLMSTNAAAAAPGEMARRTTRTGIDWFRKPRDSECVAR